MSTLYEVLPNAPKPSIDPSKPSPSPQTDGVIGPVSDSMSQLAAQLGQLIIRSQDPTSASDSSKGPSSEQSANVLTVKSKAPKNNPHSSAKNNKKNKQ